MKFMEIVEYIDGMEYQKWMNPQTKLWTELCKEHLVKKNDGIMFYKMGEKYHDFYEKKHHPPTVKKMIQLLGLSI